MNHSTTLVRTFKYRLYPTPAQERQMLQVLDVCRHWYNMCLAERKWAWESEQRNVTAFQQNKLSTKYRKTIGLAKVAFSQTLQAVCADLDKSFQAFFRRIKAGQTPGYPRFKGSDRFQSFCFPQFVVGARFAGRRLKLYGIGRVAVRWHRILEGKVKTVRIVRKAGRWYACFSCVVEAVAPLPETGSVSGIDVGVSALITMSDGVKVGNPKSYQNGQAELRRGQRKLARCTRESENRRKALRSVQRQQEHVANQRRDFLHKLSTELVRHYDGIALEDLRVRNMVRNYPLSKSILDSGWSMFREMLAYKAESAGRQLAFIDPAHTSRCCSACGMAFQDFDLSTRWVTCECGLSLDRDHNAALNILKRVGWDTPVPDNVSRWAVRPAEAASR